MNWIDLAALFLIVLAVVDGATSGLAWAALEIVVLLGAALAAKALRPSAEGYVFKVANLSPTDLPWVTHVVVFALLACVLFGLLLLVHPATKKWRFKNDRWFGALLGVVNGVLAAVIVAGIVMAASGPSLEPQLRESHVVRAASELWDSGAGKPFLPEHVPERARQLWGD